MNRDDRIDELRELGVAPSAGFIHRLRHRIERREFSAQVVGFSWHVPVTVLIAFLDMLFSIVGSRDQGSGGSS